MIRVCLFPSVLSSDVDCVLVETLSTGPALYRFTQYFRGRSDRTANRTSLLYSTNSGLWRVCHELTGKF